MRGSVNRGKPAAPPGRGAGKGWNQAGKTGAFNTALGTTLHAEDDVPEPRRKGSRILLGVAVGLVAGGLFLAVNMWIGS